MNEQFLHMDALLTAADGALRTLFARPHAARSLPTILSAGEKTALTPTLSRDEKTLAGALMRVNHVGEVCAQALYSGQALATKNAALKDHFMLAGAEEADHLAWTRERLDALGARPSLLNPLWYAGAFALGYAAGRMGDAVSLGFVLETERQVEAHLQGHLERLPAADLASRAVVAHMQQDEARHAQDAQHAGAAELPAPVKALMRASAKLMTATAHHI